MDRCPACQRLTLSTSPRTCEKCSRTVCSSCVCVRRISYQGISTQVAMCRECFIFSLSRAELADFISMGKSREGGGTHTVNSNARSYLKKHHDIILIIINRWSEFIDREIELWDRVAQMRRPNRRTDQSPIYERAGAEAPMYTMNDEKNGSVYQTASGDGQTFRKPPERTAPPVHDRPDIPTTRPVQEYSVDDHLKILLGKRHNYYQASLKLPPIPLNEPKAGSSRRIHEIFVITKSGMLIAHYQRQDKKSVVDPDIMAGMLIAFQHFIMDSMRVDRDALREFKFGEFTVIISSGDYVNYVVVMSGPGAEELRARMDDSLRELEVFHYGVLRTWKGNMDQVKAVDQFVKKILD